MVFARAITSGDDSLADAHLHHWLKLFFPELAKEVGHLLDVDAARERYYKQYGRPGDPQYEEMVKRSLEQLERFEEETRIDPEQG